MLRGIRITKRKNDDLSNEVDAKRQKLDDDPQPTTLQRESWMLAPPTDGIFTRSTQPQQLAEEEKPVELNPYYSNNGSGLPQEKKESSSSILSAKGASWRARALKRAQERAQEEGVSVNNYIKEHWGVSGSELAQSIAGRNVETNERRFHHKKNETIEERNRRSEYSLGRKSVMKAPDKRSDNLKWKKENASEDRQQERESPTESKFDNRQTHEPIHSRLQPAAEHATSEVITEVELNKLAARAMKAKLMGNTKLHEELTKELEMKKKQMQSAVDAAVLPDFDVRGKKIKEDLKTFTTDEELHAMVRDIKEKGIDSFDETFLKTMGENTKYGKRDWDDEYDETAKGMERFGTRNQSTSGLSNKRMQEKRERHEKSQRDKQIKEYRKQKESIETCAFCYRTSKTIKKHLVVALGNKVFLSLPPYGSLVPGHCIIAPFEHTVSMYDSDESEWYEIQKFKQALKKMFAAQNKDVLFLETVTPYSMRKNKHSFIECIPIPAKLAAEAPSYFRKAILEAAGDWSENKVLIDTRGKGIKRSIPRDFPYFHAEFTINGGYAHVIEDEKKFDHLFGKEIVCGMLKMNNNLAKLKSLSLDQEKENMFSFAQQFQEFDWTIELDGA